MNTIPTSVKRSKATKFPQDIAQPIIMTLMGYTLASVIGLSIFTLLPIEGYSEVGTIGGGVIGGILTLYLELK